jgi:hypothetical protein
MTATQPGGHSDATVAPLRSALLSETDRLRHGFFARRGGVSVGIYNSLNCGFGSGDDAAQVATNRRRAVAALGVQPDQLVTAYQVHSRRAVRVERPWERGGAPQADAMVTDQPGITLGILTADCAPILLADEVGGVIGAAHAGWRGAFAGIIESTIEAMIEIGAKPARIVAAIGPCIGFASYEVGPEFPEPFLLDDQSNDAFFRAAARPNHFLFDLAGYLARRLDNAEVSNLDRLAHDTFADEAAFFSYRRARHRGEEDYGRLLSAIALRE